MIQILKIIQEKDAKQCDGVTAMAVLLKIVY